MAMKNRYSKSSKLSEAQIRAVVKCFAADLTALQLILKTANIRSNVVERIWMSSRRQIAGAILRMIDAQPDITATEDNFRIFMKMINRLGGGIVFEALNDDETDAFVSECYSRMKSVSEAA